MNAYWKVEIEDDNFMIVLATSEIDAINQAEADGHSPLYAELYEED